MTPDEARSCLDRGELDVLYRPAGGEPELGAITSVSDRFVFVRYGTRTTPAATDPADLEPLTPAEARRWRFRHPLRSGTGGGNG
jgi:hypothetical protein